MNTLDKQYKELCQFIIDNGVEKGDRTQIGTLSNVDLMMGEFDVELIDYKSDGQIKAPLNN